MIMPSLDNIKKKKTMVPMNKEQICLINETTIQKNKIEPLPKIYVNFVFEMGLVITYSVIRCKVYGSNNIICY
jgi:hypothetical protein